MGLGLRLVNKNSNVNGRNLMRRWGVLVVAYWMLTASSVIAQTSLNMEFLGNKNDYASTGSYSSCWGYTAPDGREYALLGCQTGTSIIDITDAPTLKEIAFIPGPPSPWREMKTYQSYAYVVTENGTGAGAGIQIIDLSNLPNSATLAKTYVWADTVNGVVTLHPRAHTISASDNYLFLNGGSLNGIRILDVSKPLNPVQAGKYVGPHVHDSHIRNDTVFASVIATNGGLDIIDARNRTNPTRIKLIQYQGSGTHNAWTIPNKPYVVTTDEIGATLKNLKVWDIRDVINPIKVAEFGLDSAIVHNVVIKGSLAYVAWYSAGLRVIDFSNPLAPKEIAYYDTYPKSNVSGYLGAWGVDPFLPSGKVIVSDMQTGLYVLRYNPVTPPVPKENPKEYLLSQNYPNPFNPLTTVSFSLPREEFVTLQIFNVLGQIVRTAVAGIRTAGVHQERIDARDLPSGIYYYRLKAGSFVGTKKMMVLR